MAGGATEPGSTIEKARMFGEPVIELTDVRKRWPKRIGFGPRGVAAADILANVTFTVQRGEVVVLLGENGAGKTTLLKIIAGLARPDAGDVRVLGASGIGPSAALRRRIAYAGGERGFYFRLTVRENLAFFAALDGMRGSERSARILAVAQTLDIASQLDRRFADLSSGIRQRLAVARALIADPEIVLLDEPTRALDPPHASDLRRFVRETLAGGHGKTVVVATNLIDEALEVADRIAIVRAQTLVFVDRPGHADAAAIRALFGMPTGA